MESAFFRNINSFILESLSISDEITNATDCLINKMDDMFHEIEFDEQENLLHKQIQLNFDCFSKPLMVNADIYFCDSSEEENIINKYPYINDSNSYSRKKEFNVINFSFLCVKNKDNIKNFTFEWFGNTIQHELNHIFQQINIGDRYGSENHDLNKLVSFCNGNIHSPDETVRTLANAIYLSQYVEQDSFVNELDYEIRKKLLNIKDRNFYKNSEPYKKYLQLKNSEQYLINNKSEVLKTIQEENLPIKFDTLIDLCRRGEKRIIEKISKVIVRNCDYIQIEAKSTGLGDKKKLYLI